MDRAIVVGLAGLIGLAWGLASDRLAARWPAHHDGSVRRRDWRTPLVALAGGLAFGATALRFGDVPVQLVVVGLYVAALVTLFAIDLDQRLLPDVITLSLVAFGGLVFAVGASPYIGGTDEMIFAVIAAAAVPAALFVLAIPFGAGAIGQGDLKLLAGVALFAGAERLLYGLIVGTFLAGIAVVVLVLARRITLRSYVPYGPFLIAGSLWALLGIAGR
ncbi:MAG TPA: A24 family peptidase [Candidatus Deferrimicrobiaceae bacterium]|nr:A24 family peptidase [Candidatus Deferrimicrobiaceae bacterium]